jgi:hypothetical protein
MIVESCRKFANDLLKPVVSAVHKATAMHTLRILNIEHKTYIFQNRTN